MGHQYPTSGYLGYVLEYVSDHLNQEPTNFYLAILNKKPQRLTVIATMLMMKVMKMMIMMMKLVVMVLLGVTIIPMMMMMMMMMSIMLIVVVLKRNVTEKKICQFYY